MDFIGIANGKTGMGAYSIAAAEGAYKTSQDLGLTSKIGITAMIGVNDVVDEVFQLADAQQVNDWAKNNDYIALLSFWSINRDTNVNNALYLSSQISQPMYGFTEIFKDWGVSSVLPPPTTPAAARSVIYSPAKVFAPYVDILLWPTFDIAAAAAATGNLWYTLAFIQSDGNGNPSWGGIVALSEAFYLNIIVKLRALGGDVIISFGGSTGVELAADPKITTVAILQAKYQSVIDLYKPSWLDFDLEGGIMSNVAANNLRAAALVNIKAANPGIKISFTLPVLPTGLSYEGVAILASAAANGLLLDSVNIMVL